MDRSMGEYNRTSDCSRIAHDVTVALSYIRTRRFMKGIPCKKRVCIRVLQPLNRVAGQGVAYGKLSGTCFHGIRGKPSVSCRETQVVLVLIGGPFLSRKAPQTGSRQSLRIKLKPSVSPVAPDSVISAKPATFPEKTREYSGFDRKATKTMTLFTGLGARALVSARGNLIQNVNLRHRATFS